MKWLHNLLKGLSLTACLFVFQACYGTPAGYPDELFEEETVEATLETAADEASGVELTEAVLPEDIVAE